MTVHFSNADFQFRQIMHGNLSVEDGIANCNNETEVRKLVRLFASVEHLDEKTYTELRKFLNTRKNKRAGKKDAGSAYIRRIGIVQAPNPEVLHDVLEDEIGRDELRRFYNHLPEDETDPLFYMHKNRNAYIAELYTGFQDADTIRKCANWIYSHREAFGKEILEIGCDIGFMTGFLALTFPDSHITAIDRTGEGIEIARLRMEELGVTNVEFIMCDVKDMDEYRQFDTVISMRCLQENLEGFEDGITYETLTYDFNNRFVPAADSYVRAVASLVRKGGTLVTVQNNTVSPMMGIWMYMQGRMGFRVRKTSYKELSCTRPPQVEKMQAYYAKNVGKDCSADANTFWYKLLGISQEKDYYTGWAAEAVKDLYANRLVRGVAFLDPEGRTAGKYALYICGTEKMPEFLVLYSAFGSFAQTKLISTDSMDPAINAVHGIMDMENDNIRSLIEDSHYSMYMLKPDDNERVDVVDTDQRLH